MIFIWPSYLVIVISVILSLHGLITLVWMIYAWENPKKIDHYKSPKSYVNPIYSFTALIPARSEEKVIADTIHAVDQINYPDELKEILILCKSDDLKTISVTGKVIKHLGKKNIILVIFDGFPVNKPKSLNIGLKNATNQIITIFDAEDQPHRDIYHIVNTLMVTEKVDVVQSGVQLMNYRSHWFSLLNVLEYFFWFKSGLHFFTRFGNSTPLGGNTVFFKKQHLEEIGGWDENCLTEDADIGIRLVNIGAKIRVVYDEQHVTKEETPNNIGAFVKQRTRWNHGYLQILFKGDWCNLPQSRQRMISFYILFTPLLQAIMFVYLPLVFYFTAFIKLSVLVSMISFLPLYILLIQIGIYIIGINEFTKAYGLKYSIFDTLKIPLTYFPYQTMLAISSLRAIFRFVSGHNNWEKTTHYNEHRILSGEFLTHGVFGKNYA